MRSHRLVRHIARPALHTVVDAELAHRAQRLIIKSRHAERRSQLLIEFAQILQVLRQRWKDRKQPLGRGNNTNESIGTDLDNV